MAHLIAACENSWPDAFVTVAGFALVAFLLWLVFR